MPFSPPTTGARLRIRYGYGYKYGYGYAKARAEKTETVGRALEPRRPDQAGGHSWKNISWIRKRAGLICTAFCRELGRARRLFWVPLLLALLGATAMGVRAWRSCVPRHHLKPPSPSNASASHGFWSGSYYDKATAEQLAKIFPHLLQSDLLQSLPGSVSFWE